MGAKAVNLVLIALLVAGCASEVVKLHHPTTQAAATCGPYSHWPSVILAEIRLRDCVKDYQQAGYQRAP
jgi:hypothetical protein